MQELFDGYQFGLYTAQYEYNKQVYFAQTYRHFYNVVDDTYRIGMDDSNYVDDEVFAELWRGFSEFFRVNIADDSFYYINNYTVCVFYRGNFYL